MNKAASIITAITIFLNIGLNDVSAITTEQTEKAIKAGVNWLKQSQESNGHFLYEYMPFLDRYVLDDHIVRQAGTVFVLSEANKRDQKNNFDLKNTVVKGLEYLDQNSINQSFNNYQFKCLKLKETECTLGGTSLILISYLNMVEKYPELQSKYIDRIKQNLNFIMAMKLPKKGFRGSFYLNSNQKEVESDFYNGEALLALTYYYQQNPDPEIKKVIDDSMDYFDKFYSANWNNNFYLWGMAAVKNLYKIESKESYFNFVKKYTDWRIDGYKNRRDTDSNVCAYLEGITSAYSVLQTKITKEQKEQYLEEIDFWLNKIKNLQLKKGDKITTKINKTKSQKIGLKKPSKAIGGFLTSLHEPVLRIDFTQHCLSSLMQKYEDIDQNDL